MLGEKEAILDSSKSESPQDLPGWQQQVLEGILRGIFLLWLLAFVSGIYNVVEAYGREKQTQKNALLIAIALTAFYFFITILFATITFNRRLPYKWRASALIFIFYAIGTAGFALTSFSGDGRIFYFAVIILAAVLFELRAGIISFIIVMETLAIFGFLQVSGRMIIPIARQANANDPGAWISGGLVFAIISVAILTSITYLLNALQNSLQASRASLAREQHTGQVLRILSNVNQLILHEHDREKLLQQTCEILSTRQGYIYAWINVRIAGENGMQIAAADGMDVQESYLKGCLTGSTSHAFSCALGAEKTNGTFLAQAGKEDPCLGCPLLPRYPERSSLSLPIKREETIFGILTVGHSEERGGFEEDEVRLLTELTDNLAFALQKLEIDRLVQINQRKEALVNKITQAAINTSKLDPALQVLADSLKQLIEVDHCYIVLMEQDGEYFKPAAATGPNREAFLSLRLTPNELQIAMELLRTGSSLVIPDTLLDERIDQRLTEFFSIRSLIGLLLEADGKYLGAVFLTCEIPRSFNQTEVQLAEQTTQHVSLAIAKTELLRETREKAFELGSLFTASQDMASSLMDPPALLEKLARHMVNSLKATSGNIMSIEPSSGQMKVLGEYWGLDAISDEKQSDLGRTYPGEDYPSVLKAMREGAPLILHRDSKNMSQNEIDQFETYGIHSMMFVPIMSHGKLFGDVEIWESRKKRDFNDTEIRIAQAMAGHAAAILESALLYETERRHVEVLSTLHKFSLELNKRMNLSDLLGAIVDRAMELLKAPMGSLLLTSPDGTSLKLEFARGVLTKYIGTEMKFGEGLSGKVADEGQANWIENYSSWDGAAEIFRGLEIGAALGVPIRWQERVLGVINILDNYPHPFLQTEIEAISLLADQAAIAITNARLFETIEQREAYFRALIENSAEGIAILNADGEVQYLTASQEKITGYSMEESFGLQILKLVHPDDRSNVLRKFKECTSIPDSVYKFEYRILHKDGTWHTFEVTAHNLLNSNHVKGIVANFRDVEDRKYAEQELRASESKFRALAENVPSVVYICRNDARFTMLYLNDAIKDLTGYEKQDFLDKGLSFFDLYHPDDLTLIPGPYKDDNTFSRKPFHISYRILHKNGEWRWVNEWGVGVVDESNNVLYIVGVMVDSTETIHTQEMLKRRAVELEAIATASSALRNMPSVMKMIPVMTAQALRAVDGDFSSVFLLEDTSGDYVSQGWYTPEGESERRTHPEYFVRHKSGEGITGMVAASGKFYISEDIHSDPHLVTLSEERERMKNVKCGISLPLRAQEKTIGVMHVWLKSKRVFGESEINILTALSEMAGTAIHRATLYEKTVQQAEDLIQAYDNTLAGWARALELRDEVTEGHTRRVTELALKLACALEFPEEDLIHFRRGALLHDIGKLGIPDAILLKPGALNLEERSVMERHPSYATEMLSSIPYLQKAIEIPYCHHERWDGTGYPQKLKGYDIPLAARIFSVIDVWDALTSDRPYRTAWSRQRAEQYIQEQSGLQFDPNVVKAFIDILRADAT